MFTLITQFIKKAAAITTAMAIICVPAAILSLSARAADTSSAATSGSSSPTKAVCDGIGMAGGNCSGESADSSISALVTNIINIFSWVVGIVAVIMIIYAGFTYVSSGGGDGVKNAKNIIIYAVIGLIVVAFAQVIVHFAIGTGTSAVNGKTSSSNKTK